MDAYEARFVRLLDKRLTEISDARVNQVIDGVARDYAEYRERIGYLRACGDLRAIMADVRREMNGE